MTRPTVRLTKYTTEKGGKAYSCWMLRWHDGSGKRHSKSVGRADGRKGLSKRKAELIRSRFEEEIRVSRVKRDAVEVPALGEYLERYLRNREPEVGSGTMEAHRLTAKYLLEFFGGDRRLDSLGRTDARSFKTALASNDLSTRRKLTADSVHLHLRNARKMFAVAVEDELLLSNPFVRLAGPASAPQAWHEVTDDEFAKLMAAARPNWRLLLGLCRWAALRRGEALHVRWEDVDWERRRLTIIANDGWTPKDKAPRTVPIVPALYELLRDAHRTAEDRRGRIIADALNEYNVSRDFVVLCQRAGLDPWGKPIHTLRKTCLTRWARQFAPQVLKEWAGHADERTTLQFYLKVSDSDYERAAGLDRAGGPPAFPTPPEDAA